MQLLEQAQRAHRSGRVAEAESLYRRILALSPDDARVWHLLGMLLHQCGRRTESLPSLRRALELSPDVAVYHCDLAGVLGSTGDHRQAVVHLQRAISLDPTLPEVHENLAVAYEFLGRLDEAIGSHREALRLRPDYAAAHNHLGNVFRRLGRIREAVDCHRKAIALRPQYAAAYSNLASALAEQGDQEGAVCCRRKAVELEPTNASEHSALLYTLHYHPAPTPQILLEEARQWARRHAHRLQVPQHVNAPDPERRLRVGYASPDFRGHTVPRLIAPVLTSHDRSQVEVYCFSSVQYPDRVTERLRSMADEWRDLSKLADDAAAELIRALRIDILVDLAGHWADNRMTLMARKPAPIQVQIGYPGTTGLDAMDYRISDPYSDPPGQTDAHYAEKLLLLPECAWCYEPDARSPPVAPLPALSAGYVTFGCLNNPVKVTDATLQLWSRILAAVPRSPLMLLSAEGREDVGLFHRLRRLGIDPTRVDPIWRQARDAYMGLFNRIDIALDPFPYNGETTTCDGLWMGVPLVTLAGDSCRARRGVSHLKNLGLPELVGDGPDDYVRIACDLARDTPRLEQLRGELRERMATSSITNGKRYTRHLEDAYRNIWRRWCADTGSRTGET